MVADAVYAGDSLSCATVSTGDTVCWGTTALDMFFDPLPIDLQHIDIGSLAACLLLEDSTVQCDDESGRGIDAAPSGDFQSVSVGTRHACGVRDVGSLACWGENPDGMDVLDAPGGTFIDVASSFFHNCAIESGDQELSCWGSNTYGQLDAPEGGFRQVVSGIAYSCGIRLDDTVECWGDTQVGTLAQAPSGTFQQLAAAYDFICGLRANGQVECWGSDNTVAPEKLDPPDEEFLSVAVGDYHGCGIRADNRRIECWGATNAAEVPVF